MFQKLQTQLLILYLTFGMLKYMICVLYLRKKILICNADALIFDIN